MAKPDREKLRQIVKWFYQDELTKVEIAKRLRVEKRNVTSWLNLAKEQKLFRLDIPETIIDSGPAAALQDEFEHLAKVITVPWFQQEAYSQLLSRWGVAAAVYFEDLAETGEELHVGITGGETLFEFCEAVSTKERKNVHVYTTALVGRAPYGDGPSHIDPVVNAALLWAKCGRISGHLHYATVPPYGDMTRAEISAELDLLVRREPIWKALLAMDKINIVFTSIGLVKPSVHPDLVSKITMSGLLRAELIDEVASEGAIATFSNSFFGADGKGSDDWRFFLTAGDPRPERRGLNFFRDLVTDRKRVVLISGEKKVGAVEVALKAGLFNVWITDHLTLNDVSMNLC